MLRKFEDLETILKLYNVDLAFITETWLNKNIDDAAVPSYSIIRRDRSRRVEGNVCGYFNRHIPYKVLNDLHENEFETLWIYLCPQKLIRGFSCLILSVAYIPPNSDKKDFIKHITTKLDSAFVLYSNASIFRAGDFNSCPISSLSRNFTLKQIVNRPTRNNVTLHSILANMSSFCDPVHVIAPVGQIGCLLKHLIVHFHEASLGTIFFALYLPL